MESAAVAVVLDDDAVMNRKCWSAIFLPVELIVAVVEAKLDALFVGALESHAHSSISLEQPELVKLENASHLTISQVVLARAPQHRLFRDPSHRPALNALQFAAHMPASHCLPERGLLRFFFLRVPRMVSQRAVSHPSQPPSPHTTSSSERTHNSWGHPPFLLAKVSAARFAPEIFLCIGPGESRSLPGFLILEPPNYLEGVAG